MDYRQDFKTKLDNVCDYLNITYNNIDLYLEAFVHPSFANEKRLSFNYERLEFLGDAILDFLVGEYLYKYKQDLAEGDMTKIRATYVCEQANAEYSKEMHLDTLLLVGVGATKSHEGQNRSVLGNVFESFLGALYLDHDMDYVRSLLAKWVFIKVDSLKKSFFTDYKTLLQEAIQAERSESPNYIIVNETGPAHDKTFEAIVKIGDIKLGRGTGKKKQEAEQMAAKDALGKLAKN